MNPVTLNKFYCMSADNILPKQKYKIRTGFRTEFIFSESFQS